MLYALFENNTRGFFSFAGGKSEKKYLTKFGPELIIWGNRVLK